MHAAEQAFRRPLKRSATDLKPESFAASRTTNSTAIRRETYSAPDLEQARGLTVSEEAIKTVLTKVLNSPEFQSAPQLCAFLEFVVNAALSESLAMIKGYTIAVEALGRPEDFNPVTDPIVRVEAARLRRRLAKYYTGSGITDPVRIEIPKGSYAPVFVTADTFPSTGNTLSRSQPAEFSPDRSDRASDEKAGFTDHIQESTRDAALLMASLCSSAQTGSQKQVNAQDEPLYPLLQATPRSLASLKTKAWQVAQNRISVPLALILGAGCFLAGYLAGTL